MVEPKVGGFGTKVAAALKAKLVATEGAGNALSEAEAKAVIALIKAASAEAATANIPLGARADLIKAALAPLAGMQMTDSLKNLPDIVDAVTRTNV